MADARQRVWIVRPGDGATVAEVLRRAGVPPTAIEEGRVFVAKRRATRPDQAVRVGDAIRIGPPPLASAEVELVFEGQGLVGCVKPAGLPTVPDHAGASHSLVALVAKQLGKKTSALRVTSRLDRDVSGVVLFALDDAAEERLRQARAAGTYERRYVALAAGELQGGGVWGAPIGRAKNPRLRAISGADAKPARTEWRAVARAAGLVASPARGAAGAGVVTLVAVSPITGRTHQIRLHASSAGAPLLGDRDYGGPGRLTLANGRVIALPRIALHAARVRVAGVTVEAEVPAELAQAWEAIGGAAGAWSEASRCDTTPRAEPPSGC